MAERYTCIRHRLLRRIKPYDRGLLVGIIMVIHQKIMDGQVSLADLQRDGVELDRHDLLDIGGGERPSRTAARCVTALDRYRAQLDQVRATSGTVEGATCVTIAWPNFKQFCVLREKAPALADASKRPIDQDQNKNRSKRTLSRAGGEPASRAAEKKKRQNEDLAAVLQDFERHGLDIDQEAFIAEFAEAYEASKGSGGIGWFLKQRKAGRWAKARELAS